MQQRLSLGLRAADGSVEGSAEYSVSGGIQRRTVEQTVDLLAPVFPERIIEVPKILLFSWPRAGDTAGAGVATVPKTVGEPRPPGIAKNSTTTETSSGEAGRSWPRANGDSTAATAAVKSAGEPRPPGLAKHSATTERELVEISDEAGPSWSIAHGSAAAAGLPASPSRVPRQSLSSWRVAAELGLLGPEHVATVPPMQQQ